MRVLILIFCLFPILASSQSQVNFGKKYTSFKDSIFSYETFREGIYNRIPKEYRGEITDRSLMRYSNNAAQNFSQFLKEGLIYNNWPLASEYLNKILDVLKKSSGLEKKDNIKVYITRDGHPNAFMTPSGAIFITVGMLNEMKYESSLAGVLSHELAHYQLNHNIESFVKEVQGDFEPRIFFSSEKAISKYSIENELDADRLAAQYLIKSGYSSEGLLDAFSLSKRLENKELLIDGYTYKVQESTHPHSEKRISSLKNIISRLENKHGTGKNFIVDNSTLEIIKQESKYEQLNAFLSSYNYQACLESAFKYHVYDLENPTYVYYVMESIRRLCYFNVDQWKEKFIVDKYYEFSEGLGEGSKNRINGGFFDKFRHHLLCLDESDFARIEAKFYWEDESKFETYEQAFQFFFEISKLLDIPECYLSNALSLSFDPSKMNIWLEKYLSYDSIVYKTYAKSLLTGNIFSDLEESTLLVFDNLIGIIKQGPDYVLIKNDRNDTDLKKRVGELSDSNNYLYLNDIKADDLDDYIKFIDADKFSFQGFLLIGNKLKLHELDPDFWMLFKKYGINKIQFINCIYKDKVKGKYTIESYLKVADSKIDDYFNMTTGKKREFSVFVTQLAMDSDDNLTKRYFSTDISFPKEGSGFNELIKELKQGIMILNKTEK